MILSWWGAHKRDLPWRNTHDPYKIFLSEIMLQQTQVSRVLPKYAEFIEAFPTIQVLAAASPAAVLRLWHGMGYNRRALFLHKAAQMIVDTYHGKFPISESALRKLPGIGIYTARAILVFAFKQELSFVDTNIRKIIVHFFFDGLETVKKIDAVAPLLVPIGKSWEWHQALMDYGALRLREELRSSSLRSGQVSFKKVSQKPFKDSNRFYRGRVINELRTKSFKEDSLIRQLSKKYNKPREFFTHILDGLEKDGLLVRRSGKLSLPE